MKVSLFQPLSLLACLVIPTIRGHAQAATSPPIFSIGQPPQYQFDAGALALFGTRANADYARLELGVRRAIINPLTGLLGARAAAYTSAGDRASGIRALLEARSLGLSGGVDWDIANSRFSQTFSFQSAIRRGGLIGGGSMLRIDWTPDGVAKLGIGLSVPIGDRLAGRTRPRQTHVHLEDVARASRVVPAASADAIDAPDAARVRVALQTIGAYINAYSARAERVIERDAGGYAAAVASYNTALVRLFGGDAQNAARIVQAGRRTVFDHIVQPLDSLFGQAKENPRDLTPLRAAASAAFQRRLVDSLRVDADAARRALAAFDAWTEAIQSGYDDLLGDVQDSRFVWMPVEYALAPSEYAEQLQVDSLLARAVGHPFTDQNALTYLRSSDLPLEIARSIYAAREYHVLWTHDFTGRKVTREIDNVAYSMVADAYLPALTAAVKRYDSTGVLPMYMILQDQFFYEPRGNRLWMTILEDPLNASMRLKGDSGVREAHLRDRQRELRDAVAASSRLQRDARASGNAQRWLRERVKVHVNIVEQADFSFRSSHIIPGVPFTPDNVMREHRKLVFYDLDERDPYKGALLIMGVGIGEHYASATWEDRGYRVRGPATLDARRALREALVRNGYRDDQIPPALRAVESPKAVEGAANTREYVGRALQVHNEVGFARKESSVARAMLYNLAPTQSVIIVPDPMWLSDTWAGMLAGAAARGCRVYIIAPAAANAPSPQAPLMDVQYRVLARLLSLRDSLHRTIEAAGGDLRVGIFAAHAELDDPAGRAREIREGLARAPWIRQVIPFDARTLAVLEQPGVISASGQDATSLARDVKPRAQQLHQKSQLIARPGAIAALLRQPGWDNALAQSIRMQTNETAKFADQLGYSTPDVDSSATRRNDALLRGYEQTIPEAERRRVSFYFSLGTQNEDDRGIAMDAEASLIVSGVQASAGLVDAFTLMARSNWIEATDQIAQYIRPPRGWMARVAWFVRTTF